MSQRRSRSNAGAAAAAASGAGAAAAAASPAAAAAAESGDEDEPMDGAAAAAPAPAAAAAAATPSPAAFSIAAALTGCAYSDVKSLCARLTKELLERSRDMGATLGPLTSVAVSYLRRRGSAAHSKEAQDRLEAWTTSVRVCVQKQHEVSLLVALLGLVANDAASSSIEPQRNWHEWLSTKGSELEGKPEHKARLADAERKAIKEFEVETQKMLQQIPVPAAAGAVAGAAAAADEDEPVEQRHMNDPEAEVTCRLTQSLLEEPLKNTACGHLYSKVAIMEYLLLKQQGQDRPAAAAAGVAKEVRLDFKCTCPLAGCKQFVSPSTLVADAAAAKKVRMFVSMRARDDAAGSGPADRARATGGRKGGPVKEEDLTQAPDDMDEDEPEEKASRAAKPSPRRASRQQH